MLTFFFYVAVASMEETRTEQQATKDDSKEEQSLDDNTTTTTFHLDSEESLDEERGALTIALKSADGVTFKLQAKYACISNLIEIAVTGGISFSSVSFFFIGGECKMIQKYIFFY